MPGPVSLADTGPLCYTGDMTNGEIAAEATAVYQEACSGHRIFFSSVGYSIANYMGITEDEIDGI